MKEHPKIPRPSVPVKHASEKAKASQVKPFRANKLATSNSNSAKGQHGKG